MSFIVHIAKQGERWDMLAYRYYGNPLRYLPIIEANAALDIVDAFSGGERVYIPVLPKNDKKPEILPPWKT